jgi:prepilin-type N-terminal cleavage/methylation domain-containing protein/prepilin-type processing-associated H-X9-DG protein
MTTGGQEGRFPKAFTMVELVTVVAVVGVLLALLIPALSKARANSRKITCNCHLKQIGLSFRIFANDRGDLFPMGVSTNKGGSLEYADTGEAFRHFQAMSNELSTPRVLICPADERKPAATFSVLSNANISYFVGLDALDTFPQMLLAGDRNLMTNGVSVGSGVLLLTTNLTVGWTAALHQGSANVLLGDGSAQAVTSARLQEQIAHSGTQTNRLVIP